MNAQTTAPSATLRLGMLTQILFELLTESEPFLGLPLLLSFGLVPFGFGGVVSIRLSVSLNRFSSVLAVKPLRLSLVPQRIMARGNSALAHCHSLAPASNDRLPSYP